MSEAKSIYAALLAIQQGIKAPKDKKGYGYEYRTADGIMQAAKPLLQENGVICILSDQAVSIGTRYYVESTARLIDIATGDVIEAKGTAVEPDKLASMAPPQITGTASTYARKRALEGLFLLDNEKDVDSREVQDEIAAQTRQNAAGARSTRNAGNYKGNTDNIRHKAMQGLAAEMKRLGMTGEEVSALCGLKFGKTNSRDLTTGQLSELAAHLEEWEAEQMGGK
ncbi:ERF family protein [Mitsuokella jalaludinii]|uniref:ERF family protein n=1 Tax=Mitsuokella jalaludinii TaxID=187979 RepID=UPI0020D15876|nr:ERF family protein [Mitsuokella jalaludinii]MCQ1533542.1 ERF family protein [Mitsuokella jalaludinii]